MPRKKKIIKEKEEKVVSKPKIEKLPVDCVLDVVRIQEKVNEIIDKING